MSEEKQQSEAEKAIFDMVEKIKPQIAAISKMGQLNTEAFTKHTGVVEPERYMFFGEEMDRDVLKNIMDSSEDTKRLMTRSFLHHLSMFWRINKGNNFEKLLPIYLFCADVDTEFHRLCTYEGHEEEDENAKLDRMFEILDFFANYILDEYSLR